MLGWRIGSRRLKFEHFQNQNFDNINIWRNKHCYWWWNDWIVAWRSNSWILGQEIIWWPSEGGHCGYTTSESDRLDEIQRAQEHTSEPACVFEIAFETLWFRLHSHSFIWPYDPSFDFNQLEKLEVVRNRVLRSIVGWAPLVDNDWHALMQKKMEYALRHGLGDCWLEDFVLRRRLHLQWIPGPLLRVNDIPTKSGMWIII